MNVGRGEGRENGGREEGRQGGKKERERKGGETTKVIYSYDTMQNRV